MARGLKVLFGAAPRRGRRLGWLALVLGVVAVHACVTEGVVARMAGWSRTDPALPPRIEVAYVRAMALTAPAPTAAPAAPPARVAPQGAPKLRKPKPAKPSRPASAPEPITRGAAASEPALSVADAAAPLASAASSVPVAAPTPDPAAPAKAEVVASAASAASAAGLAPPFEWPVSTKVNYLLTGYYRGDVNGTAQVEWIRVGTHYQVHVDFIIGPSFAPLITQRSSSDGEITPAGLAPRRYDQDMQVFASTRPRQTVFFDAGSVILANGDVRPVRPGMQDTASQFVQLTYLFSTRPDLLKVGSSVDIPLALPKKVDVWTYDVADQQPLATPFGPIQGIHLKPRNPPQPGSVRVEMWFAPQLQYFPARLRFEQDAGSWVDLMISRPPEMAR